MNEQNSWETPVTILFLLLCLAGGLLIGNYATPAPVIGVVRFADIIFPESANRLIQVLQAAQNDESIAGVVLEIDSPGGLATSSEHLFYSLLKLREKKPLIVTVESIAASGGYYIAAAANRIYAAPSSYIGNVGVRGPRPFDPFIDPFELSTGPYKLAGAGRFDQIQQLDLLKQAFVGNVVNQRSKAAMNPLKVDAATVAEARLYQGSEALGIGYIDAEGGRSDAIRAAAELSGVQEYDVVDLLDYFGFDFTLEYQQEPTASFEEALAKVVAKVGSPWATGAAYFLDSRIPLPQTGVADLEQHLLNLRAAASNALRQPSAIWQRERKSSPQQQIAPSTAKGQ